jgi:hypothetical protein
MRWRLEARTVRRLPGGDADQIALRVHTVVDPVATLKHMQEETPPLIVMNVGAEDASQYVILDNALLHRPNVIIM